MKRLLIGILGLLIPGLALAAGPDFIKNTTPSSLGVTNKYASPASVTDLGEVFVTSGVGATNLGKSEDAAAASGDTGVACLGVRNDSIAAQTSANGDYGAIAILSSGAVVGSIQSIWTGSSFQLAAIPEDAAASSGDVIYPIGAVREDALTVNTNASGDYTTLKTDAAGRLITAPAVAAETFQSCGTATAVTSDVAIKASVASNRIYVTSITCKNTSTTVGPTLDFKDGSTIIAVGGIPATSATGLLTGEYHQTFPTPLRGTSATALNFATNTATTSVTCCAHGYISVN